MKHKHFTITLAALATLASCTQEAAQPEDRPEAKGLLVEIPITLEQPGGDLAPATKVDANLTTGVCTWTNGDQIAVNVSGAYRNTAVDISTNTISLALSEGQTLTNYAVYPAGYQDESNYSGDTPGVIYPKDYDLTGHATLTDAGGTTYTLAPMMAVCTSEALNFYHVGGMLRLEMTQVPATTAKLEVEFMGMTDVCGTCTVTNPGTVKATTAITSGKGNKITVTGFTQAESMNVNIPLPCGDYSSLTAIRVKLLDSSDGELKLISKPCTWGTLKHAYVRIVSVDFDNDVLGSVKLSSTTPVTLWKTQTVQRTAKALYGDGLLFGDSTISWSSDDEAVATVASDGTVTAQGAGSATITATATSALDGSTKSASYTVHVNSFSVSSVVAAKTTVGSGGTTSVTATLTHTNFGTVQSFPSDLSVAWTSSPTTYVTVATPSSVNVVTLQSVTTATGGTAGSSSTITASVPNYGTATANCSITCKLVADLTFPSGGEKYKFRGYYMHPGSLYWNGSSFSITDGTDPLEIVTHFATEGTPPSGSNRFYLTWTELSSLGTEDGVITGTVHADDAATGNHDWKIPTFTSSTEGELGKILSDAPSHPIQINSTSEVEDNTRNYLHVNVKLPTTGTYANKGLGYSGSNSGSSAGNQAYQAGMLLVPDGAHLTCPGMDSSSGHGSSNGTTASTSYNVIDYDDLLILVDKGCVFLPLAGCYIAGWYVGGSAAYYWSASQRNDSDAYYLGFGAGGSSHMFYTKPIGYFPVRVVRQ